MHNQQFSFKTIQETATGSYKEKGSRFLAFAFPVQSEVETREKLEEIKKKYFDARHHCFAWMLGPDKQKFRAFDDGEPNHSAGDPILGQIRSHDLTNILIVVVRYFGGVKLGVGGLIAAYRAAAADALQKAEIITENITMEVAIEYDYTITSEVMRLVKEFELKILEQSHREKGRLKAIVRLSGKDDLLEKLELMQAKGMAIDFNIA
ncbi:MAG: YigZ family protein [Cyclobacteriaceae bacterium]|nr:YigZ family protein [Cyclobacteriaceae bacterium]